MVGNNACGSHSLVYGSTRDHTIEVKTLLSDGSEAVFGQIDSEGFKIKSGQDNLEGSIYRNINTILGNKTNRDQIIKEFPDPNIKRRNTGYALDLLLDSTVFDDKSEKKIQFL